MRTIAVTAFVLLALGAFFCLATTRPHSHPALARFSVQKQCSCTLGASLIVEVDPERRAAISATAVEGVNCIWGEMEVLVAARCRATKEWFDVEGYSGRDNTWSGGFDATDCDRIRVKMNAYDMADSECHRVTTGWFEGDI